MNVNDVTHQPILWPLVGMALIILANAFFVTVEFAIVTVRKGQMERLADQGDASARLTVRMLQDPDRAIAGSQLGITVASILLGIVAEEPLRASAGSCIDIAFRIHARSGQCCGHPGAADHPLAVVILPHGVGRASAEDHRAALSRAKRTLRRWADGGVCPNRRAARLAGRPVDGLVLRLLGVGGQTGGHGVYTVEELKEVVRESQQEGVIPYSDEKMLLRAMEFGGRFVREAMIPRTDIVAVDRDATVRELLQVFKTSRHSRFPVYEADLDNICGVVTMKELLPKLVDDPALLDSPLADLDVIQPAFVVPESRRIGDLFNEMRRESKHMAIVLDEFGGTAGMVTSEELAEEVVGRLTDEWVAEQPSVASVGGGAFEIDASSRVNEVNEALGLDLPTSVRLRDHRRLHPVSDSPHPEAGRGYRIREPSPDDHADGWAEDRTRAGGAGLNYPRVIAKSSSRVIFSSMLSTTGTRGGVMP